MNFGFILLNIYALIVLIILNIVFFTRSRIHKFEDNIYGLLLITSLITITIGIVLGLTLGHDFINQSYTIIYLNKLYLIGLILTISIFTCYTAYITYLKGKITNIINKIFIFINFINFALVALLPLDVYYKDGNVISSGLAMNYTYLFFVVAYVLMIIIIITNYKRLTSKKYFPIYFLICEGFIVTIIQIFYPSINYIINPSTVLTCIIMYFTIENPDVKIVDELIENRKIIERASEEKSIFLFKMSQGLREQIKNIDEQVDMYKKGNLNKADKDLLIDNIEKNNKKMNYLINDVLGINSFDNSNIKKFENTYNIHSLLEDINKRCNQYKNDGVDYRFTIVDNIPKELYGDYIKLKQVLMSVLINALENTSEGFVHVDVNSFTKYDVCRLVITIEDSGQGIEISTINDILNQELEITDKDYFKIEKLDVDLPLAYKIIKMLGGTMYIKSEENKGTEVIITIDQYIVINEEFKDNDQIDNYINTKRKSNKILLVNDNEEEIRKIKKVLEKKDYDVVTSMFGQDVVDRIRNKEKYDVILIDDEMPLMNGINVLDELVKLKDKSKKIVLLEKDKLFIAKHYIEDGFDNYIDKTKLIDEIVEKI